MNQRPGAKGGGNNVGIRAIVRTGRKIPSSVEFASTTAGSSFVLGPSALGGNSVVTVSETCVSCRGFRRLARENIVCIAGLGGSLGCEIGRSLVCRAPSNLVRIELRCIAFSGRLGKNSAVARGTEVVACISVEGRGLVSLLAGSLSSTPSRVVTVCHGQ